MKITLKSLALLTLSTQPMATEIEFDFAVHTKECQITVAYLTDADNAVNTVEGDKFLLLCSRNKKELACFLKHKDTDIEERKYHILADTPPFLVISNEERSESILINSTDHTAAYSSRLFDEKYLGNKVCSLSFFTYDEYKFLNKQ